MSFLSVVVLNAISIDVEDWGQSVLDPYLPVTDRFCHNTRKVLNVLARHNVRGTFFVLGLAAEKAPELVKEIHREGHEIQSHGYGHRPLHLLSRETLRQDLERSKKLLEDIIGAEVVGHRAPVFSITRLNLWALDVLVEVGFAYDSSIFPLRIRGYGIDGVPRVPHRLKTPAGYDIIELPVASYECMGRRVPVGGGGYFRLLPHAIIRRGLKQMNDAGQPAIIYMHPYEYDPVELRESYPGIGWRRRLHQSLGRRGFPGKIDALFKEFRFGTIRQLLALRPDLPAYSC